MTRQCPYVAGLFLLAASCGGTVPPIPEAANGHTTESPSAPDVEPTERRFQSEVLVPSFSDPVDRIANLTEQRAWLSEHFQGLYDEGHMKGLTVGLVVDDQLLFALNFGLSSDGGAPVDHNTGFRIGSITKVFTAAAVLSQRDEGLLMFDDPAEQFLPELRTLVYPTRDAVPFSIREILTHTSGLPRLGDFDYTLPDRGPDEEEILQSLENFELHETPGRSYAYSNLGYALLGFIAARVDGRTYREVIDARVLAPLGMDNTVWEDQTERLDSVATGYERKDGRFIEAGRWTLADSEAAGGLYSTMADMARFASWQLAAHPPRNDAERGPLLRATLRESHTPLRFRDSEVAVADSPGGAPTSISRSMGIGWHITRDRCVGDTVSHNGGIDGFQASMKLVPARGIALIALTNSDVGLDAPLQHALEYLVESGAAPTRTLPLSQALISATEHVLSLLDEWDEASFQARFVPSFQSAVPTEEIAALLAQTKNKHGACALGIDHEVENRTSALVKIRCDRGGLLLKLTLSAEGIAGLHLRSIGLETSESERAMAKRIAQLMSSFQLDTCEGMFERASICPAVRSVAVAFGGGTCNWENLSGGANGELHCVSSSLRGRFSLNADGTRITSINFKEIADAEVCRSDR